MPELRVLFSALKSPALVVSEQVRSAQQLSLFESGLGVGGRCRHRHAFQMRQRAKQVEPFARLVTAAFSPGLALGVWLEPQRLTTISPSLVHS